MLELGRLAVACLTGAAAIELLGKIVETKGFTQIQSHTARVAQPVQQPTTAM